VALIAGRYQPLENVKPGSPQRARDLETAQSVLLRRVEVADDARNEALAKADSAKGIFHPSLVTLFNVLAEPDHRILLAYEYVPAQTIAHVAGGHPLNPKRAAEIVAELADAVAELHARGVTHGGIAQATVLLTMKGKAKLDRVGDPTVSSSASSEADLVALGDLLQQLAGRPSPGATSVHGIEQVVHRARSGSLESAATLAALLRRLSA
jgi:serine/threonine protein kinase